jgi:hypothetical protein
VSAFETAKARYAAAQIDMAESAIEELARIIREHFPGAVGVHVHGEYGESGELGLAVTRVVPGPDASWGPALADDLDDELNEPLLFLAAATGEAYLGDHDIDFP